MGGARRPVEFLFALAFLGTCVLAFGLSAFCCFHGYLVLFNYTTIEFQEKRGCNPPPGHVNRYDLGAVRNIQAVLGTNPLLWWLPVRWSIPGDGLSFPSRTTLKAT